MMGLAVAMSLAACGQSAVSVPTPVIVTTVLPPRGSPTPAACTINPEGLTLDVQAGGFHQVRVVGRGFVAREPLFFVFSAATETNSQTVEVRPAKGVGEDGAFSRDETLTPGPDASDPVVWSVAVVHSRGVACSTITVY
jgi:hypothetical protein